MSSKYSTPIFDYYKMPDQETESLETLYGSSNKGARDMYEISKEEEGYYSSSDSADSNRENNPQNDYPEEEESNDSDEDHEQHPEWDNINRVEMEFGSGGDVEYFEVDEGGKEPSSRAITLHM